MGELRELPRALHVLVRTTAYHRISLVGVRVRVRVRVRARARARVRGRGRARARLGSDQRRLSRRKYAIQDGIGNPVTIAAKPRVEIVMKVTITPTKRTEGPTKRLRMCKGWVVAAFSNVHVSPRHVIASPLPP